MSYERALPKTQNRHPQSQAALPANSLSYIGCCAAESAIASGVFIVSVPLGIVGATYDSLCTGDVMDGTPPNGMVLIGMEPLPSIGG